MLLSIMIIDVLNLRCDGESTVIEIASVQLDLDESMFIAMDNGAYHERRVGCGMLFEDDDRGPFFALAIFELDGIDPG